MEWRARLAAHKGYLLAARVAAGAIPRACQLDAFHSCFEGPRARAPRVPVTFRSGPGCPVSVSWRSGEVLEPVRPQNSHVSVQYAARVGLVYYLSKKLSSIFEFKTA